MNQAPTLPAPAEQLPLAASAPISAAISATPAAVPASLLTDNPARPAAPRGRYWEQLDPASKSLYPVD